MAWSLLTNSFEEGASLAGTAITTANSGAPGSSFDLVNIGTGATAVFDTAQAAHGTASLKIATGTSAAVSHVRWIGSMGSQAEVWFRLYLYLTVNPASNLGVWDARDVSSNLCSRLVVTPGGKLQFQDSAGTAQETSTNTIPLNAWFRVEGLSVGSATTGQVGFSLYTGSGGDSTTALESRTSAATLNTSGAMTSYRYGVMISTANVAAFWMDDVALSSLGPIGAVSLVSDLTGTGGFTDGGPGAGGIPRIGVDDAAGFP